MANNKKQPNKNKFEGKTLNLENLISDDLLGKMTDAFIELKSSVNEAEYRATENGIEFVLPDSTKTLMEDLKKVIELEKWKKEVFPKVVQEVHTPNSKYYDLQITDITPEKLLEILGYLNLDTSVVKDLCPDELLKITTQTVENLNIPIDRPNREIWHGLTLNSDGQIFLNVAPKTIKKKISQALIFYSIQFEELEGLEISKELTTFDKMIYIATSALYNAGNEYITTNLIYKLLGGQNKANAKDRKRIIDSLRKMARAWVVIDDSHEAQVLKKSDFHRKQGHLLDAHFDETITFNGTLVKDAIHILEEPLLITFAKERKQFTTISRNVFALPLSNTNKNLDIKDYLLTNLAYMKRGGRNKKILWSSIYEYCHITTNKDRAKNDVIKCLDYLKSDNGDNYITGYRTSDDGVIIYFPNDEQ